MKLNAYNKKFILILVFSTLYYHFILLVEVIHKLMVPKALVEGRYYNYVCVCLNKDVSFGHNFTYIYLNI